MIPGAAANSPLSQIPGYHYSQTSASCFKAHFTQTMENKNLRERKISFTKKKKKALQIQPKSILF